jgi:hypothetical protein
MAVGCSSAPSEGPETLEDASLAADRMVPTGERDAAPEDTSSSLPDAGGTEASPAADSGTSADDDAGDSSVAEPPGMAVETVQLPASGAVVMLKTSLDAGEIFLLKAWGTVDFGTQKVDPEYGFGGGAPADEVGGVDVGVDIGMLQIHPAVHTTPTPPGPGRMKWFGAFRDDHAYYMTVTGEGRPLSIKLTKPAGASSGSGAISVALLRLSPTPPNIGAELETVMVPITKTIAQSTMSTDIGKLYVLQAAGTGKVGGARLHLGDAEYMDWDETGAGKNEGEAGADFGIGVDEIVVPKGNGGMYTPRMRWWGPWRADHTYYMLFAGTGKPIQFLYFDSGYGDNSATDKLTVKVFHAP